MSTFLGTLFEMAKSEGNATKARVCLRQAARPDPHDAAAADLFSAAQVFATLAVVEQLEDLNKGLTMLLRKGIR